MQEGEDEATIEDLVNEEFPDLNPELAKRARIRAQMDEMRKVRASRLNRNAAPPIYKLKLAMRGIKMFSDREVLPDTFEDPVIFEVDTDRSVLGIVQTFLDLAYRSMPDATDDMRNPRRFVLLDNVRNRKIHTVGTVATAELHDQQTLHVYTLNGWDEAEEKRVAMKKLEDEAEEEIITSGSEEMAEEFDTINNNTDRITLVFRNLSGTQTRMSVRPSTIFKNIKEAYAGSLGLDIPVSKHSFIFDGKKITQDTQTVGEIGLEDEDCLDVMTVTT